METKPGPLYFKFLDALVKFIDYYPHTADTYAAALICFQISPEDIVDISQRQGPLTRHAWIRIFQIAHSKYNMDEIRQRLFDTLQAADHMILYHAFLKDNDLYVLSPEPVDQDHFNGTTSKCMCSLYSSLMKRLSCRRS